MLAFQGSYIGTNRRYMAIDGGVAADRYVYFSGLLPHARIIRNRTSATDPGFPLTRDYSVALTDGQYTLDTLALNTGYIDGQYSLALLFTISMIESFGMTDAQAITQDMPLLMAESLGLSDTQGMIVEIPIIMGESFGLVDAQTQQYTLILDLADTLGLLDQLLINEIGQVGYVMNMDTGAVSLYSGVPATSLGYFNGKLYGTDASGVFKMTGSDDRGDAIEARIIFRKEDFGASEMKRMLKAYLGVASDGAVLLKTITADGDERIYRADISNDVIREKRIDLGRGVYSRYWQFELMNDGGSDLTLDAVEYFPVMMTRRIG